VLAETVPGARADTWRSTWRVVAVFRWI